MNTSIFHTLYFKLSAGLSLILIVIGLSYSIFASYMVQQINLSSQQLINKNLAQNLVNDKKIVHQGKIDIKAMKDTFMQYMTINPSIEIYYLDMQGNILAYSAEPGKVKRNSINLNPVYQSLKNEEQDLIMGDDPRSHQLRKPFSATIIPSKENPQGYLYVVLQGEELTEALNQNSQNTIIILGGFVLAASLITGLLIGLFLFYRINLRLKNLQNNVADFVDNNFNNKEITIFNTPKKLLGDEISDLEKHISHMASHIQQQWSALKQQDCLRREMVANISHDLRTPLASIQGYLETLIIKFDNLTDSDKMNYLNTTSKQASGLQKLINSLFELAKLDAREREPEIEKFPLLELVFDVIAKFEIPALQKKITLEINSEINNPIVLADLGLIDRVLDNLISNALYYSHENSTIQITIASAKDNNLTVRVSDTGCGIPKNQQSLVFERFHQAHTPERTDGHAGLGLCIVKKIIELHHQHIWVVSEPEKGAQFNFTLATV